MVIHNLNLLRVSILPREADAVLVIDPDAVLPAPVSTKGLEVVARERSQVVEPCRGVQLHELALSDTGDAPKSAGRMTPEERFGVSMPEGPDHTLTL